MGDGTFLLPEIVACIATGRPVWDIPGVAWVGYFAGNGEALHSAYWHNDFGRPKSRGCINMRPADAKWLFRWTLPVVTYEPGDITVDWENRGTMVDIRVEA